MNPNKSFGMESEENNGHTEEDNENEMAILLPKVTWPQRPIDAAEFSIIKKTGVSTQCCSGFFRTTPSCHVSTPASTKPQREYWPDTEKAEAGCVKPPMASPQRWARRAEPEQIPRTINPSRGLVTVNQVCDFRMRRYWGTVTLK